MRLEDIPLYLGALVALFGLWLLWDALLSDRGRAARRERRRRARAERDRLGEATLGLGTLCVAAALVGGDTWPYGTVAAIAGTILLLTGVLLNLGFLKELLVHRGPARRQPDRAPRGPEADRYVIGASMGARDVARDVGHDVARASGPGGDTDVTPTPPDDAPISSPPNALPSDDAIETPAPAAGNPVSGDAGRALEDERLGPERPERLGAERRGPR